MQCYIGFGSFDKDEYKRELKLIDKYKVIIEKNNLEKMLTKENKQIKRSNKI